MSAVYDAVFTVRARSTHHKIALDALRHVRGPDAIKWRDLFLLHHESYFEGAKAPDATFKDFTNHVLHISENEWGGAIGAAQEWYAKTVEALKARNWKEAAYAAGVTSHYFTDPHQPFHTGQTEEEGAIHRAVEWSFNKSYETFQSILEDDLGGYPEVEAGAGEDWLAQLIRAGATEAHASYDALIDHCRTVAQIIPVVGFYLQPDPPPDVVPYGDPYGDPFTRGMQVYLQEARAGLATMPVEAAEERVALIMHIVEQNRLFEQAAARNDSQSLARVLRAFEPVLLQLATEDLAPEDARALRAQLEFELNVMLTKLSRTSSNGTQTT